jgi:hypothetical protein
MSSVLARIRRPIRSPWIALALMSTMLCGFAHAATYPLEIIAPRAGLTTTNRYYKAYPNLAYEVQVAAIGGVWPYTYTLSSGPDGMALDAQTGVLTWPSPPASSTPYPVTVSIRDQSGTTSSVTWTISVTTQGFRFIDASAASGGDGSLGKPWRSINDWYLGNKNDATYRGQFLYFRNGTYPVSAAPMEDNIRLAIIGDAKPLVWMAYPGESPTIDLSGGYISPYGENSDLYFEGLRLYNMVQAWGVRMDSGAQDVVFRKNTFELMPAGISGISNVSALMVSNGNAIGKYWTIVDNSFKDFRSGAYAILGYYTSKAVIERNNINTGTSDSTGIGPKTNNSLWFIRDNRVKMGQGNGIWVDTYATTSDMTIEYNLVQVTSGAAGWFGQENVTYGAITSKRNTYVGAPVKVSNLQSGRGPISFTDDVMVNSAGGVTMDNTDTSLLTRTNVLAGTSSSGIVDSAGSLTGNYVQYVGLRGFQRAGGVVAKVPSPPVINSVQ